MPEKISVVIPVLDEEDQIGGLLEDLTTGHSFHEIVVVDGGSRDRTVEIAGSFSEVDVASSDRGRALQMNCGAVRATGDVLLFLHADVRLPNDAAMRIHQSLRDDGTVAGAFCIRTVAEGRADWLAPLLRLADLRCRYTSLPYGDQALFVRAEVFRQIDGFPRVPIFEDVEICRRLREVGEIARVRSEVTVSGRRFEARPFYYFTLMILLPLFSRLGVPPRLLADFYGQPR